MTTTIKRKFGYDSDDEVEDTRKKVQRLNIKEKNAVQESENASESAYRVNKEDGLTDEEDAIAVKRNALPEVIN